MIKFLMMVRFIPLIPLLIWDEKLIKDLNRWKTIYKIEGSDRQILAQLLWEKKEFRNLFIYRNRFRKVFKRFIALLYKPMDTLYLEAGEIGGGLFIQHGFATVVAAQSIGENCWINQQVTIGFKGDKSPVIEDNVMITCGAKVLGGIHIGKGAVIGANAVVVHDVEVGAVMGGVPAKRLK